MSDPIVEVRKLKLHTEHTDDDKTTDTYFVTATIEIISNLERVSIDVEIESPASLDAAANRALRDVGEWARRVSDVAMRASGAA